MNRKEMSECFGIMMTNGNWEKASMFQPQKLQQTVEVWTLSLSDIDYDIAQMALVKILQECVYPPTVAEFRSKAKAVVDEIEQAIQNDCLEIRNESFLYGSVEAYYRSLPRGRMKTVITRMGGPEALTKRHEDGFESWNWEGYREMYWSLVRKKVELAMNELKKLTEGGTT